MATVDKTGTGWQLFATGPGKVTFTPLTHSAFYRFRDDATVPPEDVGHVATAGEDKPLRLETGERLYVKGDGRAIPCTFTADT